MAEKRREAQGKGEKERNTCLNAEFQRIARRDKKAFLRDQFKEIEENNRMGRLEISSRKLEIPSKGTFHAVRKKVKLLSHVQLFAIPWTVAYQAPPSMEFSRQEYWSGLPFPSLGDLPDPGIEPRSPSLQADALPSEPPGKPQRNLKREAPCCAIVATML